MLNTKKLFTKILGLLTDTGWTESGITGKYSYLNVLKYRVKNGVCYVIFQTSGGSAPALPTGTWTILGTLPAGARPSLTVYSGCGIRSSGNGEVQVGSDGRIGIYPGISYQIWAGTISFPVG